MFKRDKMRKIVSTEGMQEDSQQLALQIQSRLENLEKVQKLVGKYGDLKIGREIEKERQDLIEGIKKLQALGVSVFDILGRWGQQLFEANILKARQVIDDNVKINGESKLADFIPEDKLIADNVRLQGIQQLRENSTKNKPFYPGLTQEQISAGKLPINENQEIIEQFRAIRQKETALDGLFQRLNEEYQNKDRNASQQIQQLQQQQKQLHNEITNKAKEIKGQFFEQDVQQKQADLEYVKTLNAPMIKEIKQEIQHLKEERKEAKEDLHQQIQDAKAEIQQNKEETAEELKGLTTTQKQFYDQMMQKIKEDPAFNYKETLHQFEQKYAKYPRLRKMFKELSSQIRQEQGEQMNARLMPESSDSDIERMQDQLYEQPARQPEEVKSFNELQDWNRKPINQLKNAHINLFYAHQTLLTDFEQFKRELMQDTQNAHRLYQMCEQNKYFTKKIKPKDNRIWH